MYLFICVYVYDRTANGCKAQTCYFSTIYHQSPFTYAVGEFYEWFPASGFFFLNIFIIMGDMRLSRFFSKRMMRMGDKPKLNELKDT